MCQVAFLNGLYHSYVLLISWTAAGGIGKALLLFISPALLSYILLSMLYARYQVYISVG